LSFNILEHLSLLDITQSRDSFIEAKCPVCSGKLKINNNKYSTYYGAYKCWTNFCSTKEIREELGVSGDVTSDLYIPEVYIPPAVKYKKSDFCEVTDYVKPKSFTFYSAEYDNTVTLTYYYYTDKIRVKRIYSHKDSDKYLILEIFINGNWINRNIASYIEVFPLYYNGIKFNKSNIFMAEGEKVADYLCSLGYPCATPCTMGFDFNRLTLTLLVYSNKIKNILYLPDYDSPGLAKAKIVLHSCWAAGIGAKSVTLDTLFPNKKLIKGMDLADFDPELVNITMRKLYNES
jgi:hypothetical protein